MLNETKYKVMGINDDESTCSHCGKTGLKRVVWLCQLDGDGNVNGMAAPYGTTCAAWKLKITTDKLSRSNARIEAELERRLTESIAQSIAELRKGWVVMGSYLVPPDGARRTISNTWNSERKTEPL